MKSLAKLAVSRQVTRSVAQTAARLGPLAAAATSGSSTAAAACPSVVAALPVASLFTAAHPSLAFKPIAVTVAPAVSPVVAAPAAAFSAEAAAAGASAGTSANAAVADTIEKNEALAVTNFGLSKSIVNTLQKSFGIEQLFPIQVCSCTLPTHICAFWVVYP